MIDMKVVAGIETPALLIDMQIVRKNLKEYHDTAAKAGVKIRPHTKTHKMPELAKLQMEYGSEGIVVAKSSEAEVMANAGIDNIFVAYPVIGREKLERLALVNKKINNLFVCFDSLYGAKQYSDMALESGKPFKVIVEVDVADLGRTGYKFETCIDEIMEASVLPGIEIVGVYGFAWLTRPGRLPAAHPRDAGVDEAERVVEIANILREKGLNIRIVAGGSSPTGRYVATVPGITEIHPGGYIFNDQLSRTFGITEDDCAASVLTTVTSMHEWRATVDMGTKSLYTDVTPETSPGLLLDGGMGWIQDKPDLKLAVMSEEHGVIIKKDYDRSKDIGSPITELHIGEKIRIVPNHVCPTVNLYDYCYFVDGNEVRKVFIANRGKVL